MVQEARENQNVAFLYVGGERHRKLDVAGPVEVDLQAVWVRKHRSPVFCRIEFKIIHNGK